MHSKWQLDPLVSFQPLDTRILVYHSGSGDTHLLHSLSGEIVAALSAPRNARTLSLNELRQCPRIAALTVSDRELTDALATLKEAGVVRLVTDQ